MEKTQCESLSVSSIQGEPGIAGFKGEQGPKGEPVSICSPASLGFLAAALGYIAPSNPLSLCWSHCLSSLPLYLNK